jgi:hypothetical protein
MSAAIRGQLRSCRARLPAVPFDINPRHTVRDISRRLCKKILENYFRRHVHGDYGQPDCHEHTAQATIGYPSGHQPEKGMRTMHTVNLAVLSADATAHRLPALILLGTIGQAAVSR